MHKDKRFTDVSVNGVHYFTLGRQWCTLLIAVLILGQLSPTHLSG